MSEVYWLQWEDENEEHLARHDVTPQEIRQILSNRFITMPNLDEGQDRIYLVGETSGGRILQISLAPTIDPTTWRPVTGFPAPEPVIKLFRSAVR
jgi:hypothetical protein